MFGSSKRGNPGVAIHCGAEEYFFLGLGNPLESQPGPIVMQPLMPYDLAVVQGFGDSPPQTACGSVSKAEE
jgi:hypothetical protein